MDVLTPDMEVVAIALTEMATPPPADAVVDTAAPAVKLPAVIVTGLNTMPSAAYVLTLLSCPGPCVCPATVTSADVESTLHVACVVPVRSHAHCSKLPFAERLMMAVLGPAVTVCGMGPLIMQAGSTLLGRLVMVGQERA